MDNNIWDDEDIPCISEWDGDYPNEEDAPFMFEDDMYEATSLNDDVPF